MVELSFALGFLIGLGVAMALFGIILWWFDRD